MVRNHHTCQFKWCVVAAVFLSVFCLFEVAEGQKNGSETDDTCFSEECYRTSKEKQPILETEDKLDDLKSLKTARKYYRSCLATHEHAEQNMQIFKKSLSSWGGWPMITNDWQENDFNWQKLLVNIERSLEYSPLTPIRVEADRKSTSKRLMTSIDNGDLPFCPYVYLAEDREQFKQLVVATALEFAKVDKRILDLKQLNEDAEKMLILTKLLCRDKKKEGLPQKELDLYNSKTIKELQELTNALYTTKPSSKINWLELINNFFDGSIVRVNENETVIVNNIDYILQVMRTVDVVPQRDLANYMLFHKIASKQKYLSTKLNDFTNFDFGENTNDAEAQEEKHWWLECVQDTRDFFEHAIGYEYVKLHFDKTCKEKATELVRLILDSFIENLNNNVWMDEQTRRKAVEKAEHISPMIGHPEWYKNTSHIEEIYSEMNIKQTSHLENLKNAGLGVVLYGAKLLRTVVLPSEFAMGPTDINAGYLSALNAISIPAALFQPPFYVSGRPAALNYGAIGTIIGHELSHAFDIEGRMGDKDGNLVNWWTSDTLERYLEKEKCFEKQYIDYPVPELNVQTEVTHLDGKATVSENMADNGLLKVAFQAYRKYVSHHGKERHLPGLNNYTFGQLFFVGYATVWCVKSDDEAVIGHIISDEHSPKKYRVLIP